MRKTYILDTSVLVNDPNAFKKFPKSTVIIPSYVLEELDKLKTQANEAGKNARVCIRALDAVCELGDVSKGINIDDDVILKINTDRVDSSSFGENDSYVDNKILACAVIVSKKTKNVTLVSRDINLRIRARAYGIKSEDYENNNVNSKDLYQGYTVVYNEELGKTLLEKGYLDNVYDETKQLNPNEFAYFCDNEGDGISIGKRVGNKIVKIKSQKPWGLSDLNIEQAMSLDLLMDQNVPLVCLAGGAGSGKTLCAIASALELVISQKKFKKCCIFRPVGVLGQEIGFLKGSLAEKLAPSFFAIMDSFEFLLEKKKTMLSMWMEKELINFETIAYLRGRSLHDTFIIVDECQNISPHEIKAILSRAGKGTKIVLTGDYTQVDLKGLDAQNNAMTYVIEKFKSSHLSGSIVLNKCERSLLADEAIKLL